MKFPRLVHIFAVVIPIITLLSLTLKNEFYVTQGTEYTFPIRGYDPRDLLSGHYIQYRVDYGITTHCSDKNSVYYLCLAPYKSFKNTLSKDCKTYIRGICEPGNRFVTGIEKFFVPEDQALTIEKEIQTKNAEIIVSVIKGEARVKALVINGKKYHKGSHTPPQ